MDFLVKGEMFMKENGVYISVSEASKILGIPKKSVQTMINLQILVGLSVGDKTFITKESLYGIMGQKSSQNFGHSSHGYPTAEELSSLMTKPMTTQSGGVDMKYKGYISTPKSGSFIVQIDKGKSPEGKRLRESKRFKTRAEAEAYLDSRLNELNSQSVPVAPTLSPIPTPINSDHTDKTFEQYALYLLDMGIGKGTSRTLQSYRAGLNHAAKYIGAIPMVNITQKDINKLLSDMTQKYANSIIKNCFASMKYLFEYAYDEEDLPSNPMRKVECPKSKKPVKKKREYYTDQEIEYIFRTSKVYDKELYAIFCILECTGMRPGELRALEIDSFDPKDKSVTIYQAATYQFEDITDLKKNPKSAEILSTPKSVYGVRTLELSDLAVTALQEWLEEKAQNPSKAVRESKYIFSSKTGSFKPESSCQSLLYRYKEKYGIEDMGITFYKFRHTMCTRLLLAGTPIKVVQALMGDNTAEMVMKVYAHLEKEMARENAKPFYKELNQKHIELVG